MAFKKSLMFCFRSHQRIAKSGAKCIRGVCGQAHPSNSTPLSFIPRLQEHWPKQSGLHHLASHKRQGVWGQTIDWDLTLATTSVLVLTNEQKGSFLPHTLAVSHRPDDSLFQTTLTSGMEGPHLSSSQLWLDQSLSVQAHDEVPTGLVELHFGGLREERPATFGFRSRPTNLDSPQKPLGPRSLGVRHRPGQDP